MDSRALQGAQTAGGQGGTSASPLPGGGPPDGGGGLGATSTAGVDANNAGAAGLAVDSGPPPLPTVAGCADLDTDGVADCMESSATNPDFKQDVSDWTPEMDVELSWDPENAAGDPPSGSALVASTGVIDADSGASALRAASQCLAVASQRLVTVYANARVDTGQDAGGHAEIDVFFFDSPGCMGALSGSFSTPQPLDASPGSWLTLKAGSVSGDSVKSMLVKLALSKPFRASAYQARFDNVLVKVQSP